MVVRFQSATRNRRPVWDPAHARRRQAGNLPGAHAAL